MPAREIVLYAENPDVLRRKSEPVGAMNKRVRALIQDLKDTLIPRSDGAGLAAPQINAHERVVVVRLGLDNDNTTEDVEPVALVNPEILEARDEKPDFDGCLSFPGLFGTTKRPHYLRIKALDEHGQPFERELEGFDAILVHHEIDHLDGVLFIDRIEHLEDLYTVQQDADGKPVRVPVQSVTDLVD